VHQSNQGEKQQDEGIKEGPQNHRTGTQEEAGEEGPPFSQDAHRATPIRHSFPVWQNNIREAVSLRPASGPDLRACRPAETWHESLPGARLRGGSGRAALTLSAGDLILFDEMPRQCGTSRP